MGRRERGGCDLPYLRVDQLVGPHRRRFPTPLGRRVITLITAVVIVVRYGVGAAVQSCRTRLNGGGEMAMSSR